MKKIAKYACSVRALCPMTTCFQRQMSLKEKADTESEQQDIYKWSQCTCGHCQGSSCRHEVFPSVAPNASQASVYDEQLAGIGGEIALSRNTPHHQWRRSRHSVRIVILILHSRCKVSDHDHIGRFNDPSGSTVCPFTTLDQFEFNP